MSTLFVNVASEDGMSGYGRETHLFCTRGVRTSNVNHTRLWYIIYIPSFMFLNSFVIYHGVQTDLIENLKISLYYETTRLDHESKNSSSL